MRSGPEGVRMRFGVCDFGLTGLLLRGFLEVFTI